MVTEKEKEIIAGLQDAVIHYKVDRCRELAQEALPVPGRSSQDGIPVRAPVRGCRGGLHRHGLGGLPSHPQKYQRRMCCVWQAHHQELVIDTDVDCLELRRSGVQWSC